MDKYALFNNDIILDHIKQIAQELHALKIKHFIYTHSNGDPENPVAQQALFLPNLSRIHGGSHDDIIAVSYLLAKGLIDIDKDAEILKAHKIDGLVQSAIDQGHVDDMCNRLLQLGHQQLHDAAHSDGQTGVAVVCPDEWTKYDAYYIDEYDELRVKSDADHPSPAVA